MPKYILLVFIIFISVSCGGNSTSYHGDENNSYDSQREESIEYTQSQPSVEETIPNLQQNDCLIPFFCEKRIEKASKFCIWTDGNAEQCSGGACFVAGTTDGTNEGVCIYPCNSGQSCSSNSFCDPQCGDYGFDTAYCIPNEYSDDFQCF